MKTFGLVLEEGSGISNLTVSSGTSFPVNPNSAELSFRSDEDLKDKGLYLYLDNSWNRIATTKSMSTPSGESFPISANKGDLFYRTGLNVQNGLFVFGADSWGRLTALGEAIDDTPIGPNIPSTGAFTSLSATLDPTFTSTGSMLVPLGTTGQRVFGAGAAGRLRFNITTNWFEGNNGNGWFIFGGSPSSTILQINYTYTGVLDAIPIALLTPPPTENTDNVADYSGKWVTSLIISGTNQELTGITFTDLVGILGSLSPNTLFALDTLSFPVLTDVGGDFGPSTLPVLTNLNCSALARIGRSFSPNHMSTLSTLSFSSLISVGTFFAPGQIPALASMSFPALVSVGTNFNPNTLEAVASINFPALKFIGGSVSPSTMNALSTLIFPVLETVGDDFVPSTMAAVTTISCQMLKTVQNIFAPNTMAALTSLNFSSLISIGNNFAPNTMAALTTLNFSSLAIIGGNFNPNTMAGLSSLTMPALTSIGGNFSPNTMAALTTISLPSIVVLGANITSGSVVTMSTGTAGVTSLTFGASLKKVGNGAGNINITSAALSPPVVDNLLIRLAALDGTNGTTEFRDRVVVITGTSGAPSASGINAKNILIARGCSVTTN